MIFGGWYKEKQEEIRRRRLKQLEEDFKELHAQESSKKPSDWDTSMGFSED